MALEGGGGVLKSFEWDEVDVILFSGDAYVDHPAFGAAVIGRVLQNIGLRVAIVPQPNWFSNLEKTFLCTSSYIRMCWLKAIGGAWTTTHRMHESVLWPCIFGCLDCKDEILHYLECPVLWQLAREALHLAEDHFSLGHRLCFINCSESKLQLLAYCHSLYHALRNDSECVKNDGGIKCSRFIQTRSTQLSRAIRTLIS